MSLLAVNRTPFSVNEFAKRNEEKVVSLLNDLKIKQLIPSEDVFFEKLVTDSLKHPTDKEINEFVNEVFNKYGRGKYNRDEIQRRLTSEKLFENAKIERLWGENLKKEDDIRYTLLNRLMSKIPSSCGSCPEENPVRVNKIKDLTLCELVLKLDFHLRTEREYSMSRSEKNRVLKNVNAKALDRFFYAKYFPHINASPEDVLTEQCISHLTKHPDSVEKFKFLHGKISGMYELKMNLFFRVICPIFVNGYSSKSQVDPPSGILFYGPPGCGKTHVATVLAQATQAEFVNYSQGSHGSKYQNETARKIQEIFDEATVRFHKEKRRTIIFIDEVSSVLKKRDKVKAEGEQQDTVDQFLRNMDGCYKKGITVIGATNFIAMLDKAAIRPGRIDLRYELPAPSEDSIKEMFEKELKNKSINVKNLDLNKLAHLKPNFTPASIKAFINDACALAAQEDIELDMDHFKDAAKQNQRADNEEKYNHFS